MTFHTPRFEPGLEGEWHVAGRKRGKSIDGWMEELQGAERVVVGRKEHVRSASAPVGKEEWPGLEEARGWTKRGKKKVGYGNGGEVNKTVGGSVAIVTSVTTSDVDTAVATPLPTTAPPSPVAASRVQSPASNTDAYATTSLGPSATAVAETIVGNGFVRSFTSHAAPLSSGALSPCTDMPEIPAYLEPPAEQDVAVLTSVSDGSFVSAPSVSVGGEKKTATCKDFVRGVKPAKLYVAPEMDNAVPALVEHHGTTFTRSDSRGSFVDGSPSTFVPSGGPSQMAGVGTAYAGGQAGNGGKTFVLPMYDGWVGDGNGNGYGIGERNAGAGAVGGNDYWLNDDAGGPPLVPRFARDVNNGPDTRTRVQQMARLFDRPQKGTPRRFILHPTKPLFRYGNLAPSSAPAHSVNERARQETLSSASSRSPERYASPPAVQPSYPIAPPPLIRNDNRYSLLASSSERIPRPAPRQTPSPARSLPSVWWAPSYAQWVAQSPHAYSRVAAGAVPVGTAHPAASWQNAGMGNGSRGNAGWGNEGRGGNERENGGWMNVYGNGGRFQWDGIVRGRSGYVAPYAASAYTPRSRATQSFRGASPTSEPTRGGGFGPTYYGPVNQVVEVPVGRGCTGTWGSNAGPASSAGRSPQLMDTAYASPLPLPYVAPPQARGSPAPHAQPGPMDWRFPVGQHTVRPEPLQWQGHPPRYALSSQAQVTMERPRPHRIPSPHIRQHRSPTFLPQLQQGVPPRFAGPPPYPAFHHQQQQQSPPMQQAPASAPRPTPPQASAPRITTPVSPANIPPSQPPRTGGMVEYQSPPRPQVPPRQTTPPVTQVAGLAPSNSRVARMAAMYERDVIQAEAAGTPHKVRKLSVRVSASAPESRSTVEGDVALRNRRMDATEGGGPSPTVTVRSMAGHIVASSVNEQDRSAKRIGLSVLDSSGSLFLPSSPLTASPGTPASFAIPGTPSPPRARQIDQVRVEPEVPRAMPGGMSSQELTVPSAPPGLGQRPSQRSHAEIVKGNTVPEPTSGRFLVMGSLPSLRRPSGPAGGRVKEEQGRKGKLGGSETKALSEIGYEDGRVVDGETSSATLSGTHDRSRDVDVNIPAPSNSPAQPGPSTNGANIDYGEDKVTREGSPTGNRVDGRKQDENTMSATPCASAKGALPIVVKIPVSRDREKQAGTASIRTEREAEPATLVTFAGKEHASTSTTPPLSPSSGNHSHVANHSAVNDQLPPTPRRMSGEVAIAVNASNTQAKPVHVKEEKAEDSARAGRRMRSRCDEDVAPDSVLFDGSDHPSPFPKHTAPTACPNIISVTAPSANVDDMSVSGTVSPHVNVIPASALLNTLHREIKQNTKAVDLLVNQFTKIALSQEESINRMAKIESKVDGVSDIQSTIRLATMNTMNETKLLSAEKRLKDVTAEVTAEKRRAENLTQAVGTVVASNVTLVKSIDKLKADLEGEREHMRNKTNQLSSLEETAKKQERRLETLKKDQEDGTPITTGRHWQRSAYATKVARAVNDAKDEKDNGVHIADSAEPTTRTEAFNHLAEGQITALTASLAEREVQLSERCRELLDLQSRYHAANIANQEIIKNDLHTITTAIHQIGNAASGVNSRISSLEDAYAAQKAETAESRAYIGRPGLILEALVETNKKLLDSGDTTYQSATDNGILLLQQQTEQIERMRQQIRDLEIQVENERKMSAQKAAEQAETLSRHERMRRAEAEEAELDVAALHSRMKQKYDEVDHLEQLIERQVQRLCQFEGTPPVALQYLEHHPITSPADGDDLQQMRLWAIPCTILVTIIASCYFYPSLYLAFCKFILGSFASQDDPSFSPSEYRAITYYLVGIASAIMIAKVQQLKGRWSRQRSRERQVGPSPVVRTKVDTKRNPPLNKMPNTSPSPRSYRTPFVLLCVLFALIVLLGSRFHAGNDTPFEILTIGPAYSSTSLQLACERAGQRSGSFELNRARLVPSLPSIGQGAESQPSIEPPSVNSALVAPSSPATNYLASYFVRNVLRSIVDTIRHLAPQRMFGNRRLTNANT